MRLAGAREAALPRWAAAKGRAAEAGVRAAWLLARTCCIVVSKCVMAHPKD